MYHHWPKIFPLSRSLLLFHGVSLVSCTNYVYCLLFVVGRQSMLAVGDSGGTLHILEVPWSLSHSSSNEVEILCLI